MRKKIQIWGTRTLAVVALVFAVQYWGMPLYKQYFTPKQKVSYIPTTKVREGKFVISFHEIGTLEAEKSVSVSTPTGGRIIRLIQDGIVVKPGDELVILDTSDLTREVRNAQLTYQNALADVARAEAELEILKKANETEVKQAEAQLEFDKAEAAQAQEQLRKKERLAADKLVPGDQVEQAQLQLRAKELAVTKGEMALVLKKREVESKEQQKLADIAKVKFAADIAKSALDEVMNRVNQATINAPAGGLVVIEKTWSSEGQRKLQEGDTTRPRQTICTLPELSRMLVKVQVGESDAPKIKIGVPVVIRLEAVPNKVYHGSITDISRLATESSAWEMNSTPGRKNFEVTITVKETDPKTLNPGMTADVEFICDAVEKAVFVPIECITEIRGKTYVYVKEGNRFVRTEVTTGKSNDNFICITKGLKKGQIVALRDPTRPMDEQEAGFGKEDNGRDKMQPTTAPIPNAGERKD